MEPRFVAEADRYLGEYLRKIADCVGRLSPEQVWWRPNGSSNSVGNLLLHLAGNLSQWVLAGLGGQVYERHRAAEFAADGGAAGPVLVARLTEVVTRAQDVVRGLRPEDLARPVHVQGHDTDGLGVVFHVVEHMAYHTGQIVHVTKQLRGEDADRIEFYPQHRGE
jgi:uncharacterized damage-inducible protein DinB